MTRKEFILQVLYRLWEKDISMRSLIVVIENSILNDEAMEKLISIFVEEVRKAKEEKNNIRLQKSVWVLDALRRREKKDRWKELYDLNDLLSEM